MEFKGFRSIAEYERECKRLSYHTKRIPFHKGEERFFLLVTAAPFQGGAFSGVESWYLFDENETVEIDDCIISNPHVCHAEPTLINGKLEGGYMRDGIDVNYVGRLAKNGYFPDDITNADGFSDIKHEEQWKIALARYAA